MFLELEKAPLRNLKILFAWNRWYLYSAIGILLYSFFWIYGVNHRSKYTGTETELVGRVQSQTQTEQGSSLTIYGKEAVQIWTHETTNYPLGSIIQVKGKLTIPKNNTVFNQFNHKQYFRTHQIYYQMNATSMRQLQYKPTILEWVKQQILTKISQRKSSSYLKTFLVGDKQEIEPMVKESYQHNGISHLFALSGMHVSFLTKSLDQLLKRGKSKKRTRYCLINGFLFLYVLIVGQVPSLYRAFLSYLLYSINEYYQLGLSPLKRLCLVFQLVLILNPYFLFDVGFQYSFLLVFFLTLAKVKHQKQTHPIMKIVHTSILAFVASIPLTIYYFSEINLMSPILNLVIVPFVTYLFFPITLVSFFLPFLEEVVVWLGTGLEQVSLFFETTCHLVLIFAKPTLFFVFLEYGCLTLSFSSHRHTLLVTVLLFGNRIVPFLNPNPYIIFIDVGQGDSTLVVSKHNQCNLLIDTGGLLPSPSLEKNTLVMRRTIPLLKSLGITHLDYLILTHDDYDHAGEAEVLVNNFKVKHIITNEGASHTASFNRFSKKKQVVKENDQLVCGKYLFQILSPDHIDKKENNNSLVIASIIEGTKILWMADAEKSVEKRLIREYNLSNWDILKVGHHGSDTSSSQEFIHKVNPKISIISVGKNNRYHHPSQQVVKRLKHHRPYFTSHDGSIKITLHKQGNTIRTCPP